MNESDRYTGSARLNPPAPRLFTYTIPIDDGAAPNPFRGMCSLAICKPGIRSTARKGDWVAGLGSSNAHSGDLSGRLVYAMRVEEVMSLSAGGRSTATGALKIGIRCSGKSVKRLGEGVLMAISRVIPASGDSQMW